MPQRLISKIIRLPKLKIYIICIRNRAQGVFCFLIKFYQSFISQGSQNCRFYPSCSEYTYLAIKKYGLLKGCWMGVKRIIKCYPWHPGGIDLP